MLDILNKNNNNEEILSEKHGNSIRKLSWEASPVYLITFSSLNECFVLELST